MLRDNVGGVSVPDAAARVELIYGKRPRTKGKIENQFRFVQRDFVLENNIPVWRISMRVGRNGWRGTTGSTAIKDSTETSPADHYVKSLRRPTAEELELLLTHDEPRKVTRTMASFIGFRCLHWP
jgi:hypothetical protein